ncbi:39S ribosomal protein L22, mitochondrial [Hylaeus anthracinus]|uniref:39S ribosomal protein L22, mitochondrial n=1 Tax=Hylaeus anthracinus TaxID=313031 RepID=UPI0023B9C809|nr:39S ribosomal protein L22, mitochondrial [Hylaeus anthracinus]
MQSIKQCLRFTLSNTFGLNNSNCSSNILKSLYMVPSSNIHGSSALHVEEKKTFLQYNKVIYPPQKPGEERRPGYVCHVKKNIKYSPDKMWYVACLVRGMTVDEAVKQLSFLKKKGAAIAKEVILEAQHMAVEEHNIEFKSNLWVAESFVGKGIVIKGIRRHARARPGEVRYKYTHYFVRLEEGKPPENYYAPPAKNGGDLFGDWMAKMRRRKVFNSL